MRIIIAISLLLITTSSYGQRVHHQTISAQSSNNRTSSGIIVKQTLGQLSTVGNFSGNVIVQQGYHQSNWKTHLTTSKKISATVYPNPFAENITFNISNLTQKTISIEIFDIDGKMVYTANKYIQNNQFSLHLKKLPIGLYLVKLNIGKLVHHSKIIKK